LVSVAPAPESRIVSPCSMYSVPLFHQTDWRKAVPAITGAACRAGRLRISGDTIRHFWGHDTDFVRGTPASQARYWAITVERSDSERITNGLPHLPGRPT
jgi:hypothetical protein